MKGAVLVANILVLSVFGDCAPCSSVESLDISEGFFHPNGSVFLHGIEFTNATSYEVEQNGTVVRYGCPCIERICMWKCCGVKQAFHNFSCSDSTLAEVDPFSPPLYNGREPSTVLAQDTFFYMHGRPCVDRYLVDTGARDQLFLQENGTLIEASPDGTQWHDPARYCLDMGIEDLSQPPRLLGGVCYPDTVQTDDSQLLYTAYAIGLLLSVPFLLATFLVYALIPDLRNLHGMCLMAYCAGLIVAYPFLAYLKLHTGRIGVDMSGCLTVGQLQNAFTFAPDFQKGIHAASRIVIQLKQKPKIVDPPVPDVVGFVSKGKARFQDVDFRYPTRLKQQVLRELNLQVDSGKTVALVGASGCGKSTVIQLLQRFYDPEKGVVYLDNYPVPQLRMADVRASFGLVSQEPVLFALSIKENIAYGDNSREPSMVDIVEAARQANIHDFIVSLPEGYETNIGSKGVQLSGGQKQRVAIARALIRKPKILLLDEATSALDSESERAVLQALETARSGRTCIVIAHRLTTVRDADVIHVIDAGRAVETGTHDQLIQANGVYARLYHAGV